MILQFTLYIFFRNKKKKNKDIFWQTLTNEMIQWELKNILSMKSLTLMKHLERTLIEARIQYEINKGVKMLRD